MTNYERTKTWLAACGKTPSPGTLSLQIGCHLEEFVEFLDSISVDQHTNLRMAATDLSYIAQQLKTGKLMARIDHRVSALDALCDCEVTGNGVAYLAGFDKPAADAEVLASNESKLVDGQPVLLPGGKIGKGPNYVAPKLEGFV